MIAKLSDRCTVPFTNTKYLFPLQQCFGMLHNVPPKETTAHIRTSFLSRYNPVTALVPLSGTPPFRACPITDHFLTFHHGEGHNGWLELAHFNSNSGDKDEKSVNGTQIPLGSFHQENGTTFSEILFIPEKFPVERAKTSCSIYIPNGISRFFGKCKTLHETFNLPGVSPEWYSTVHTSVHSYFARKCMYY